MHTKTTKITKWLFPAFILLVLAVLLRFFSFFPSVINHDESTYLLVARELLHGKHYFVDVIDIKPIGIFLLYAVFLDWFGDSIVVFRLIGTLWIVATAFGLYYLTLRHLSNQLGAWAAAVGYILMTSVYTYYGVTPNTELFFNGFTVLALILILGGREWWRYLVAGSALGIGFLIKYVVAFDALAFGLLVILLAYRREMAPGRGLFRGLLMLISFLAPLAFAFQYYRLLGYQSEFLYFTFEVPGRYPVDSDPGATSLFFLAFFFRYIPVTGLAVYAMIKGKRLLGDLWPFFGVWLLLDVLIIGWPGKHFGHYFIQIMPAVCLLAGVGFGEAPLILKLRQWFSKSIRWGFASLVILVLVLFQKKDYYDSWDHPREVAEYLEARLQPGDQIYTGNYHHILYFLLKRETPTPYVHRSLLWDDHHVEALEIDLEQEARQILELRPRFLTLEKPVPPSPLADSLQRYYKPITVIRDRITIYEWQGEKAIFTGQKD